MSAPSTPTSMHGAENRTIESVQEMVLQVPDMTQNKDTGDGIGTLHKASQQHVRH